MNDYRESQASLLHALYAVNQTSMRKKRRPGYVPGTIYRQYVRPQREVTMERGKTYTSINIQQHNVR